MNYEIEPDLEEKLIKIKATNKVLSKKIRKQLELFSLQHQHPSLRVHKLSGSMNSYWSISIDRSVRMLFIMQNNIAIFFDIGTHDQVYKK